MKKALERLSKSKHKIKGLILDLRGNPGGLFDQSVRVADLLVQKGLIVVTRGRPPRKNEVEKAHKKGTWLGFPVVCLINEGTASAAEIVAGALQDHRRALTLGGNSFGKGSVQTIIDLNDGSGLKITIARYYTPLGRKIQGRGLKPDLFVKASKSGRRDPQLKAALYYLKNPSRYQKALGRGLPKKMRKRKP